MSPLHTITSIRFTINTIRKSRTLVRLFAVIALVSTAAVALGTTTSSANVFGPMFTRAASIFGGKSTALETKAANLSPALHAALNSEPLSPSSTMATERRGHTATRLSDGRVLIAGGESSSGVLNQTELYDPAADTFSAAANMSSARADHTATLLSDGRVLIAGGRNAVGAVASTEIFNPATGTFTSGPNMSVARAGHTATLFADGRILFAGGDGSGSAEILDASLGSSSAIAAPMNDPRSMHSAALLQDGRVLIVGGRDASNDLSSGEIFDPSSSSFTGIGGMEVARIHPLLRVLFDGKVQIIGGRDDRSMEIYDSASGVFGGYAQVLPDGDLHADLINEIMASPTRSALLTSGQSVTELASHTQALSAGGSDSNGDSTSVSTVYPSSPASVSADKVDYIPETQVIITGRGFQPNEMVTLTFHEYPHVDTAELHTFSVQADADGNFTFDQYSPEAADLGITYILGAKGQASGWTAQTTFHDSVAVTPGSGGTNISADKAANATSPAFTTLGDIVISEAAAGDFSTQTNTTLILTAPTGWQFNPGVGSTQATKSGPGGNELNDNSISVTNTTITVNISVTGTGQINTLSIKGIQVRATDGANVPGSGNILRTVGNPGTAPITGITNGSTNFGSLSQTAGAVNKLIVTLPGQTFTDGTTVAGSGNSGSVATQTAGTPFNISSITATDQFFNVVTTYSGAKTISYTGPGSNAGFPVPSYTTAVTFAAGVSTTTLATTLRRAETTTITASDGTTTGPVSSSFTVNAGSVNSFVVTNTSDGNIGTQTAGTPFNIKVRALDSSGNTVTSFDGGSNKVMISPSSGTLSAGGGSTDAFVNGVLASWPVTFSTSGTYPGSFSLTATGIGGNAGITGTSNTFTVNAPACTNPSVTTQPTNQTVTYGTASVSFTSAASGTPTPTIQWQVSTGGPFSNLANNATYSGVTTGTLTVSDPGVSLSGNQYRVVFTNTCGGPQTANSNAATLTVNPKALTVTPKAVSTSYTGVALNNTTYSDNTSNYSITGFVNSETVVSAGITLSGTMAFNGSTSTVVKNVGTYTQAVGTLSMSSTGNNYSMSFTNPTPNNYVITAVALTVTPNAVSTTYNGVALDNTSYSDNTSNYSITGFVNSETVVSAGITLSGSMVFNGSTSTLVKNVGTYTQAVGTLTLNSTNNNYSMTFSNPTPNNYVITSLAVTLTGTRAYDGSTNATAAILTVSNAISVDTVNVASGSGTLANKDVGLRAITDFGTLALGNNTAGNYTLTGATGSVTITALAVTLTGTRAYDGSTNAAAAILSVSNAASGDTVNVASGTGTLASKDVGLRAIASFGTLALGNNAAGNYTLTGATGSVTITPALLDITANNDSKTYGQTRTYGAGSTAFTSGAGQLKNGDTIASVTITDTNNGGTATAAAGGSYPLTPTAAVAGGTTNLSNYDIHYHAGALTVNAALLDITANNDSKTYGETRTYGAGSTAFTTGAGQLKNGDTIASVTITDTNNGGAATAAAGGNYPLTPSAAVAGGTTNLNNYDIHFYAGVLTVIAARLDITANNDSKTYGQTRTYGAGSTAFTTGAGQLKNGDTIASVTITDTNNGGLATAAAGGNYPLTPSAAVAGGTTNLSNYDIHFYAGALTVNAARLNITANNDSKTYGETKTYGAGSTAFTTGVSQLKNGDTIASVTITDTNNGGAATAAAGGNYPLTPSAAVAGGTTNLSNYDIHYYAGALNVGKHGLTVSATGSMTYGGSPTLTPSYYNGFVNGDTQLSALIGAPSLSCPTCSGAGAGTTQAIVVAAGNLAATNYSFNFVNGSLTVGKALLTVKADDKTTQYSDLAPLTATITGYVNGDIPSSAYSGAPSLTINTLIAAGGFYSPAGTYANAITAAAGTLTSNNYNFTYVNGMLTINKEDAGLEYSGDMLKTTGSTATNSTTSLQMAAVVREAADGYLGDKLNTTQIKFTLYKFADTTLSTPVATCTGNVAATGPGTGSATCTLSNIGADNYMVTLEHLVNPYYSTPVEDVAVTVVLGGTGFTTGGGWLNDPNLGSRSNFGFTVKYLKNGNVQGNSLYIYRMTVAPNSVTNPSGGYLPAGQYNWIIKSNSMGGLTQTCTTTTPTVCAGTFAGKNNITAVNRATGVAYSLGGNYNFQVDLTDASEPGSSPGSGPDTYAIRVWDTTTGTYYQLGSSTAQLAIIGGNIQVKP
jgi:hypothetical protein